MLDHAFVDSLIDSIIEKLETHAIRAGIHWRDLFEPHRGSLKLCESEHDLEERVNAVLVSSRLSHIAFFGDHTQAVPSRMAIAATVEPFDSKGTPQWMFQDVHAGGPADQGGVKPGDLLVAIDGNAARAEPLAYLTSLIGGEAGLRCGEIMALEWTDIDLKKRQLCVARWEWRGHVTLPKGGCVRHVPLTQRLTDALREWRHLRSARAVCNAQGQPLTQKVIQGIVARVARRAGVRPGVHIRRHSFCSHLAMRGAPVRAIQELAGHQHLATTQGYMRLSPSAIDAAIRLLEQRGPVGYPEPASALAEAAGVVPRTAAAGRRSKPGRLASNTSRSEAEGGGGGGSRTASDR